MSGQPVNTKSDQIAFRKAYMKTLTQQIANDDKNFAANQIYRQTGLPQQPTDTRTTTEKLRDIEALKPMIRSKLLALMDGGEAERVVSLLPTSEIEFLAQNVDNLVTLLEPRFKIGMYADIFLLEMKKYAKEMNGIEENLKENPKEIIRNFIDSSPKVEDEYKTLEELDNMTLNQLKAYAAIIKKKDETILIKTGKLNKQLLLSKLKENDDVIRTVFGEGVKKKVKIGRGLAGRPRTRNYEGSTRPKRSHVLTKEDIDYTAGVKVEPRFVPFGKYVLNKKQLANNIVALKTQRGSNISAFKANRVSTGMGIVLRKMTGGGNPSFEELSSLTGEERNYLSKIAEASNIEDKFSIPAPSKKEDEKDVNQFEIMRGEIMAGNDSTELVKKFKLLIIKLAKKELLPAREAKDLLYELVHLGY